MALVVTRGGWRAKRRDVAMILQDVAHPSLIRLVSHLIERADMLAIKRLQLPGFYLTDTLSK